VPGFQVVAELEKKQEEYLALEAQYNGLQALVTDLLLTNQRLREQIAQLKRLLNPTALATHPPPHPGH
jgi:hypothetical protein